MTVLIKKGKLRLWFPVPLSVLRLPLFPNGSLSETELDGGESETGWDGRETVLALYRALKQARRDFRGLELVHVWSADGEEVIVKL